MGGHGLVQRRDRLLLLLLLLLLEMVVVVVVLVVVVVGIVIAVDGRGGRDRTLWARGCGLDVGLHEPLAGSANCAARRE